MMVELGGVRGPSREGTQRMRGHPLRNSRRRQGLRGGSGAVPVVRAGRRHGHGLVVARRLIIVLRIRRPGILEQSRGQRLDDLLLIALRVAFEVLLEGLVKVNSDSTPLLGGTAEDVPVVRVRLAMRHHRDLHGGGAGQRDEVHA